MSCHSSSGMPGRGATVSVTWRRSTAPGVAAAERGESGEQFVEHGGQRVYVDGGARRQALDDLGRQVVGGADDRRRARGAGRVDQLGHAEVGEQRGRGAARAGRGEGVQQDVLGLDVAVHDARRVRGGQPVGDVRRDGDRGLRREPAVVLQARAQVRAADQLHDEREVVAVDDEVADADHARVVEAEQGAALLTNRSTRSWSEARSSRSSLTATGPSGPSPSHTVPALPRPRIW